MDGARRTWSVFDGFTAPRRSPSWAPLIDLIERGQDYARAQYAELPALLAQWHAQLEHLGGDPSCFDWTSFRPLRTDREERWSDWLHHFISTSVTGHFAHQLLSRCGFERPDPCASPEVLREETSEDRRADLVLCWRNGEHCQVEVKVGDRQFEKTYDTAEKLQRKLGIKTRWTHYILLPREDEGRWRAVERAGDLTVHVLTWDDVAIALRRALRLQGEHRPWLAWAHGFCGLIEQKLIGIPQTPSGLLSHPEISIGSVHDTSIRVRQISILKRGLEDA